MKLHVEYMAQLRAVIGLTQEEIELPEGSSLAELVAHLAGRHGRDAQPHLVTETGETRPSLLLVVNDAAVSVRRAASTVLYAGDEVTLLPPIAGG